MAITTSGTSITFNDSTVQSTAARGGLTTVTLTSAAPNATLTSGSNQLVNIVTDSTKPINPSVTLPAMTSLVAGQGYFSFTNNTPFIVAIKDSGGTIREFIAPGSNQDINILDITSATGKWAVDVPPAVVAVDPNNYNFTGTFASAQQAATQVRLDATNWAVVRKEGNNCVAELFTINTTTKAVTQGNKVTVFTVTNLNFVSVSADSDGAGHALVCYGYVVSGGQTACGYFGLSVSGGTLYASANTVFSGPTDSCFANGSNVVYCGYLGSNDAYAFCINRGNASGGNTFFNYIRGCRVTGTTTVTITDSASNTIINQGSNTGGIDTAGSRTSLTDFTFWGTGNIARAISYSPSTNTFTVTTRSTSTQLALESVGNFSSFAVQGFMYSTGKVFYGPNVYDITNSGAAGVTTTLSTGFNFKTTINPAYQSISGASIGRGVGRSAIYVSSTQVVAVDGRSDYGFSYFSCDPSTSTLNLQKANGLSTANTTLSHTPVLLSTSYAVMGQITANATTYPVIPAPLASPISG